MEAGRNRRSGGRRRLGAIALIALLVVIVGLTAVVVFKAVRHGQGAAPPSVPPAPTDLVVPGPTAAAPVALPELTCAAAPTVVSMWAHQDDDLIFAEPDLDADVSRGDCVRSVYVTAGDAGFGTAYYQSREFGILRAYNVMRGSMTMWDRADVTLQSGPHLTVFTPQDDPKMTVAFLRLPDGGLDGTGFPATGDESLTRLAAGLIPSMDPLDGYPAVTGPQLLDGLEQILRAWHADELYTLVPAESPLAVGDHPDHSAVGSLARQASAAVGLPASAVRYYLGYPSQDRPVNVTGDSLARKLEIYRAYAERDPVVACATDRACLDARGFGQWLQRSYPLPEGDLGVG